MNLSSSAAPFHRPGASAPESDAETPHPTQPTQTRSEETHSAAGPPDPIPPDAYESNAPVCALGRDDPPDSTPGQASADTGPAIESGDVPHRILAALLQHEVGRAPAARIPSSLAGRLCRIYLEHRRALCRHARRIVGSTGDAEDLVQDVFADLWECRQQWVPEGSLTAYVYRAVKNRAIDLVRHWRIAAEAAPADPSDIARRAKLPWSFDATRPDHVLLLNERHQAVRQAIERLPPRRRQALRLTAQEELTYAEAASAMDISIKTIEKHIVHSYRELRGALATLDV